MIKSRRDEAAFTLMPNPFAGLSETEVTKVVRNMAVEADKTFRDSFSRLQRKIRRSDPLLSLSWFATYFLSGPLGYDPEVEKADPILQHHVEILQALTLVLPEDSFEHKPVTPSHARELEDLLRTTSRSFHIRRLASLREVESLKPRRRAAIIEAMRLHTQVVRNWGYPEQIAQIVRTVFAPLEEDIEKKTGVRVRHLIDMCLAIIRRSEDRLNAHRDLVRPILKARTAKQAVDRYLKVRPDVASERHRLLALAEEFESLEGFAGALICHTDMLLGDIYTFTLDDFVSAYPAPIARENLRTILVRWSHPFGSLTDFDPEHIFLANPIWARPLLQLSDEVFAWPIPGLFFHSCFGLMESVINGDSELVSRYEKCRSMFLEDEIEGLVRNAFATALVFRGCVWHDKETGKTYENDLLVVLDSYAIVIEAKSGRVTAPARRGAPSRLEAEIDELIAEPSEQACRFADFLKNHPAEHQFTTVSGRTNNVDASQVRHVVRLGITLECLAALGTRLPELCASGFLVEDPAKLTPNISLADLEIIFEILEGLCTKIHYLVRRAEFDQNARYTGDELDLLVFYLKTGFNIGETEFKGPPLLLGPLSKELDPYFVTRAHGKSAPKPSPRRTAWWDDILTRMESGPIPRWTDVGYIMLNVSYEDQRKFQRMFSVVKRNVIKNWQKRGHRNSLVLLSGPPQRRDVIVGLAYKNVDKNTRNGMMVSLAADEMRKAKVPMALVIGVDVDREDYPYTVLCLVPERETAESQPDR